MFVAKRKSKEGRGYKYQKEMMQYRIRKIQEMCASGAYSESVEQILNGESSHGASWLIGRHAIQKKPKGKYVASPSGFDEMKQQLRSQMEEEMEAKMNQKLARFVEKWQKEKSQFKPQFG